MLQISSRDAQIERTPKIGQLLLRWPLRNQDFARQAIQAFLELYQSAKAEGDFQLYGAGLKVLAARLGPYIQRQPTLFP